MASFKVVLALALISMVAAAPQNYGQNQIQDDHKGMPYNFEWAVKDDYSGNDFGQNEESDGNVVSGSYYVLLPDGRLQRVTYTADHESGFVADVQYQGEASYPEPSGNGNNQQGGYGQ